MPSMNNIEDSWGQSIIQGLFLRDGGFDSNKGTREQKARSHKELLELAQSATCDESWSARKDVLALWGLICIEFEIPPPEILIDAIAKSGGHHPFWIGQLSFDLVNHLYFLIRENERHGLTALPLDLVEITPWRIFLTTAKKLSHSPELLDGGSFTLREHVRLAPLKEGTDTTDLVRTTSLLREIANPIPDHYFAEVAYLLARLGDESDDWLNIASDDGFAFATHLRCCMKRADGNILEAKRYALQISNSEIVNYVQRGEGLASKYSMQNVQLGLKVSSPSSDDMVQIYELMTDIVARAEEVVREPFSDSSSSDIWTRSQKPANHEFFFVESQIHESAIELCACSAWHSSAPDVFRQLLSVRRFEQRLKLTSSSTEDDHMAALANSLGQLLESLFKWLIKNKPGIPRQSLDAHQKLNRIDDRDLRAAIGKFESNESDPKYFNLLPRILNSNWPKVVKLTAGNPRTFVNSYQGAIAPLAISAALDSISNLNHPFNRIPDPFDLEKTRGWYAIRNDFSHDYPRRMQIYSRELLLTESSRCLGYVERLMAATV